MIKLLAAVFFGFICLIVVIANAGLGGRYFGLLFQLPFGDKIGHFFLTFVSAELSDCRGLSASMRLNALGQMVSFRRFWA